MFKVFYKQKKMFTKTEEKGKKKRTACRNTNITKGLEFLSK